MTYFPWPQGKLYQTYAWVLPFHNLTMCLKLAQSKHNLKDLGHSRLHVLLLAVTWLAHVDCFFCASNIACAKRFGTNNLSIPEISGTLDSYPVLAANAAPEHSHHLLPAYQHCLTLEPSHCVKFLIKIVLSLLKHIKLNVSWLSILFCSSIVIFIRLFVLSFHYHKRLALTTGFSYSWSVATAFCTENSQLLHVILNSAEISAPDCECMHTYTHI